MGNAPLLTLPGPWRIPVQIDASILVLMLVFLGIASAGTISLLDGAIFFAIVLVSILLHEFGHAWACTVQGVPVKRVVLHGGGGFCEHQSAITHKQDEFIALAGPIVNLAIWAICVQLMQIEFIQPFETVALGVKGVQIPAASPVYDTLEIIARINLFLGVFNMVPVLPLDGGRVLHAWLHRLTTPIRATHIVGAVGVIVAILWIPAMFAAVFNFGFVLLFIPPLRLHWRMMRSGRL